MSEISKRFNITYPTSLQSFTFLFFLTVMNLDISFLSIHYETVDVNVYMYLSILLSVICFQSIVIMNIIIMVIIILSCYIPRGFLELTFLLQDGRFVFLFVDRF